GDLPGREDPDWPAAGCWSGRARAEEPDAASAECWSDRGREAGEPSAAVPPVAPAPPEALRRTQAPPQGRPPSRVGTAECEDFCSCNSPGGVVNKGSCDEHALPERVTNAEGPRPSAPLFLDVRTRVSPCA